MHLARRGYLAAILIIGLGLLGLHVSAVPTGLWRWAAVGLILALLAEYRAVRRWPWRMERSLTPPVRLGRPAELVTEIGNAAARPLHILTREAPPATLDYPDAPQVWSLPAGGHARQTTPCVPLTLGAIRWSRLDVRLRGPFGLAWWDRRYDRPIAVSVAPDRLGADPRLPGLNPGGARRQPRLGSGGELAGLRPYRAGDPLRAVDWKATARTREWTVRQFEEAGYREVVLLVDIGRTARLRAGRLTRLEVAANLAARFGERAAQNGDRLGLITFAEGPYDRLAPAGGLAGLRRVRAALAQMTPQPRESNPLSAAQAAHTLVRQRGLIVFLTEIEEPEAADQLLRGSRLLQPKHLPLIAGLLDPGLRQARHAIATDRASAARRLAAEEWYHGMQNTALQLQRLGAEVVLAEPDRLDTELARRYRDLVTRRRI
jgi:uncharacterized protein (DUF58 family)